MSQQWLVLPRVLAFQYYDGLSHLTIPVDNRCMYTCSYTVGYLVVGLLGVGFEKYGDIEALKSNPIHHLFDV